MSGDGHVHVTAFTSVNINLGQATHVIEMYANNHIRNVDVILPSCQKQGLKSVFVPQMATPVSLSV